MASSTTSTEPTSGDKNPTLNPIQMNSQHIIMSPSESRAECFAEDTNLGSMSVLADSLSGTMILNKAEFDGEVVGEFPQFPKLPIELQIKIWELTLPGPRIVRVEPNFKVTKAHNQIGGISPEGVAKHKVSFMVGTSYLHESGRDPTIPHPLFNTVVPSLRATRKSRAIALKRLPFYLRSATQNVEIRFGPQDALEIINLSSLLQWLVTPEVEVPACLAYIPRLVVIATSCKDKSWFDIIVMDQDQLWSALRHFDSLQKVVLVLVGDMGVDTLGNSLRDFQTSMAVAESNRHTGPKLLFGASDLFYFRKFLQQGKKWKAEHPNFKVPEVEWETGKAYYTESWDWVRLVY